MTAKSVCVLMLGSLLICMPVLAQPSTVFFNVKDYGAVAGGQVKITDAVKKTIAAAVAAGGGTVYFPPGEYLTGPIHLKSHIRLFLDAGTTLKFSTDFEDYLPMVKSRWEGLECLNFSPQIYAYQAENIAIVGRGTIDGQGKVWWDAMRNLDMDALKKYIDLFQAKNADAVGKDYFAQKRYFLRPPMIQPVDCKRVRIEGVKLQNPPFWTCNPVYCDDVTVTGLSIKNPANSPNTDGINPDSCSNVHISDCHISVGDDCITIKSGRDEDGRRVGRPCENITITNCTMLDGHGGVVIGSEMSGSVRKVTISNCVFVGTDRGIRMKTTRGRGGIVEDIRVSNIVMSQIPRGPFYFNMFYTRAPQEPVSERTPKFRNIHISDIIVKDCPVAGYILGLPEMAIENVTFNNLQIQAETGFVCKDAKGVEFNHVLINTDKGPALQCENTQDLEIEAFKTTTPHMDTPVMVLKNVQNAYIRNCTAVDGTETFLQVDGEQSRDILVQNNNLKRAAQAVVKSETCPSGAVTEE